MVTYRDPGLLEFDTALERGDAGNSQSYILLPGKAEELFGTSGRIPVVATFDDVHYRGSLVTYGGGQHLILVLRSICEQIGKEAGDSVHVTLALDTEPRVVELEPDVQKAFKTAKALDPFRAMNFSYQREYALWIEEAKRPETRTRRIQQAIERVNAGRRLR